MTTHTPCGQQIPNGETGGGRSCLRCGHVQVTDSHGRLQGVNKFSRGLCQKCYAYAKHRGLVDEIGTPPGHQAPTRSRTLWSREKTPQGYVTIKTPAGIMPEHRWVMQQYLKRPLAEMENVHHINGVRDDNRIENLELWATPQPYGQRVSQLIEYMAEYHADAVVAAISKRAAQHLEDE